MQYILWSNDLATWAIALAISLAVFGALYFGKLMLVSRLNQFASETETYLDDIAATILAATHGIFLLILGMYVGSHWLEMSDKALTVLSRTLIAASLLQAARWGDVGVKSWLYFYRTRRSGDDAASTTSTAALGFVARLALWALVALMILDNFGVNITTLIASLGIGGIAVALALQNILGDLFSSLSIVLDKPFVVGDYITVDDIAGTVEYVGLKTTRIRALSGEQVVFSNSDILKSRIRNYKRMETRRIVFSIGVTYEIDEQKLKKIPTILREAVEAQSQVKFDRAHFKSFGLSSLDFEVVYIMQVPEYSVYMDVQQEINFLLFKGFQNEGIQFAYPTQSLHLVNPEIRVLHDKPTAVSKDSSVKERPAREQHQFTNV